MIITFAGRAFKAGIVIFAVFCLLLAVSGSEGNADGVLYDRVIDGDTFVMAGGSRVRLLGLDAPERGEPYAGKATAELSATLRQEDFSLEKCTELDKYGRILAVVHSGDLNINLRLLRLGLARPMLIPPCGRPGAQKVLETAAFALQKRRGLYAIPSFTPVEHSEAESQLGKKAVVYGRIRSVFRSKKALHLNFGEDWKTDFSVVIFNSGLARYEALGLDPAAYEGRWVYVLGKIKKYNGPEIIVNWPEQILPLP